MSAQLQSLMVINKSKHLDWQLKFKSHFLSLITWILWSYSIYFITSSFNAILYKPIFLSFYIHEIIQMMFSTVALLIMMAIIWSSITVSKQKTLSK